MTTLQNNFTSEAQSKRLLELGVPAWTADCFITLRGAIKARQSMCLSKDFFLVEPNYTPCWSVGRLIEIHLKCCTTLNQNDIYVVISRFGIETGGFLQNMYDIMCECALLGKYDFSKLKESYGLQ